MGKCLNIIGLKLSGPGDFFELKPLRALLTFSNETVSLCIFHNSSFLTVFVLSYCVCFFSVCDGKCVSYKCLIVSIPGVVSSLLSFLNTLIAVSYTHLTLPTIYSV